MAEAIAHILMATLAKSTPLILAAFGGLISESSGVINFALEGMMLTGAFGAVLVTYLTGSAWAGLLGGAAGGLMVGILHALASLVFRANQIVSSIALNLLAAGTTGMLLNHVFSAYGTSPSVKSLPDLSRVLSSLLNVQSGGLSTLAEGGSILTPIALLIAAVVLALFRWSPLGLRVRACGENPEAASAAGLSVMTIRFLAVLASGILGGLAGAYLSIGELSQFVENMTQGRGYLAIAALILGRWTPGGVLLASLLFGLSQASSEWLAVRWSNLPNQAFLAFPYIVCFAVLMFRLGKREPPSALGRID